jgi:hypothetical protein
VTKDERTAAESIILTFRKTRNAFAMCKFILGKFAIYKVCTGGGWEAVVLTVMKDIELFTNLMI